MTPEELSNLKKSAIKDYTEAAQAHGTFNSFVVKCIEDWQPQAAQKARFKFW